MHDDPIVNEVRKTRERLAEKYDFDISAIFKDLQERQGMLGKSLYGAVGKELPNKRLHLTGIPLRSIPAGEPHIMHNLHTT